MNGEVKLEWRKVSETSEGDLSINLNELKVEKGRGEGTNVRVYTISLGDKSIAISVTEDGKLRRVVANDLIAIEENERSVKKRVRTLVFDYVSKKVTVTEGEIEKEKGSNDVKSLRVLKEETKELK